MKKIDILNTRFWLDLPQKAQDAFNSNNKQFLPTNSIHLATKKIAHINFDPTIKKPRSSIDSVVFPYVKNSEEKMGWDAIFAVSKLLERNLNEAEIFSIHAAALCYKNKGVLLLGDSGAGKTTTAINSVLKNRDVELIGGSRIIMQNGMILGSAGMIRVRKGSIISEFRRPGLVSGKKFEKMNLDEMISLTPEELGLGKPIAKRIKIKELIFVKKLPVRTVHIWDLDPDDIFLRLYDALSFYSERLPAVVLYTKTLYPDLFGERLRKNRVKCALKLGDIPSVYIEGDPKQIVDQTLKRLTRD
jgi:hypothetical protein